ncbi:MAG TPA: diguanylate cyclase [Candidatus Rifleibacterium sp.]|nr:diguanylate cyclase [Candidatus Rifleibacterium sp.]HPT45976.1 diguanylate cyclase [Candidatus Rifleibacterium sp.]
MKLKDTGKTNLNAYLFANLAIVGVLLIGIWNRKPVWDVNLRFPNLLLILVIINTVLLFRESILGGGGNHPAKSQRRHARKRSRNLNELRAVLRNATQIDETLLNQTINKLHAISGSETVALYLIEGNQSRQLAASGEMPPALAGSRFFIRGDALLIKYSGNLGEEEIGKLSGKKLSFKSAVTRLEMTALPLQPGTGAPAVCVFSNREQHRLPPLSLPSIALFLETLLALVENARNEGGDTRYKDKNTGLLLHSCFADSFETEVERSERYKQEMSLLTIRIKGYEALDGSQKQILDRNAAQALKQSLRRLDLMFCGQADHEFIAILTETGVQVAGIVAQRVQKSFAKQNEKHDFINKDNVSMLIGAATYPADATHGAGLLEKSLDACNEAAKDPNGIAAFSNQKD